MEFKTASELSAQIDNAIVADVAQEKLDLPQKVDALIREIQSKMFITRDKRYMVKYEWFNSLAYENRKEAKALVKDQLTKLGFYWDENSYEVRCDYVPRWNDPDCITEEINRRREIEWRKKGTSHIGCWNDSTISAWRNQVHKEWHDWNANSLYVWRVVAIDDQLELNITKKLGYSVMRAGFDEK